MNAFDMAWGQAAWLWLMPLVLLPWIGARLPMLHAHRFSSLGPLPPDRPSAWMARALRLAGSLAIGGVVVSMAGPYRPEYEVERQGQGAEIVLLLDRSRSMDQSLVGSAGPLARFNPTYSVAGTYSAEERLSKAEVARRALAGFAARRYHDRFAMLLFSTVPLKVLDFTEKPAAIQAAIEAGAVGRGVSNTDIGQALLAGLALFEHRAYTGSRVLLLVSDGGDHLEPAVRERLASLLRQHRVSLVWIYIRSPLGPSLDAGADAAPDEADTVPEYFLHRFFKSLPTPYRAYEAVDPQALERAVADVDRLENLPIAYTDTVPRRDLTAWGLAMAALALVAMGTAQLLEVSRWR